MSTSVENADEFECNQASAIIIDNNTGSKTDLNKSYEFLCEPAKDLIDVDAIDFSNDENWLYSPSASYSSPVEDLNKWLYDPILRPYNIQEDELLTNRLKFVHDALNTCSTNKIDTRTFTRPKKRFSRPSIEKYNEQYNVEEMNSSTEGMKKSFDSGVFLNNLQEAEPAFKSAEFDLSQPTSNYFDRILAQAPDLDSFQNMSPPSLVNSMCSSTFANLMESSFIKNDPVLKEIVDTDFTNIIMQEEPQLYQSMTESCSSLTSDPEAFLKRVSLNETVKRTFLKDADKTLENEQVNVTFEKVNGLADDEDKEISPNSTFEVKNDTFSTIQTTPTNHGTYRRFSKLSSSTFRKSDKIEIMRNNTFKKSDREGSYLNNSDEKINNSIIDDDILEKKRLSDATFEINDINRLSYENNDKLNGTFTANDRLVNNKEREDNKRSSMIGSTGSADSLDRMSSISNGSSKESNKMLNFADVDAIVQMQEKSLQQVMSTPKPNSNSHNFMESKCISPINHYYESDSFSCEDFKMPPAQPPKFIKTNGTKMNAVSNTMRGSYGNLAAVNKLGGSGSQSQLSRPKSSNLNRMGQNLKGSYTSLKPISANLPVAPPLVNGTMTVTKAGNVTRTMEVKETKKSSSDPNIVKPQIRSGLPRPVGSSTGIPRPTSRIPGPKSNIRPSVRPSSTTRHMTDG